MHKQHRCKPMGYHNLPWLFTIIWPTSTNSREGYIVPVRNSKTMNWTIVLSSILVSTMDWTNLSYLEKEVMTRRIRLASTWFQLPSQWMGWMSPLHKFNNNPSFKIWSEPVMNAQRHRWRSTRHRRTLGKWGKNSPACCIINHIGMSHYK